MSMMPMTRLAGGALVLLSVNACAPKPDHLSVGSSDTVVVNGRGPAALTVHAFDRAGREIRARGLRYETRAGGDHVRISRDGVVTCDGRGDAIVVVSSGSVSTRGVIRCQPIRGFRHGLRIELLAGESPEPVAVSAVGLDGAPVTAIAGRMSIRDTAVVRLVGGRVVPRARGETYVDVEAGDCAVSVPVEVLERVATPDSLQPHQEFAMPSLRLGVGESRSWQIPAGRFELWLEPQANARDSLMLAGLSLNCARFPGDDRQHYSCVSYSGGRVIVRHPRRSGAAQSLVGQLLVRRLVDPASRVEASNANSGNTSAHVSRSDARRSDKCVEIL
jgi:hypothetical protein